MRKIPTVFVRDPDDRKHVLPQVHPGCEWVLAGEGIATIKYDGVCTMFDGEHWWARRSVKLDRITPPGWFEVDEDPVTGTRQGWEPIGHSAFAGIFDSARKPYASKAGATYELVGPKVNGNHHKLNQHLLIRHGLYDIDRVPRDFEGLRTFLANWPPEGSPGYIEGIVFWRRPDDSTADMAKIKACDFGGER